MEGGAPMKELLCYIAQNLADNPDQVSVEAVMSGDAMTLQLRVAQEDMGKVIGRQGRIAKEIRTVVRSYAQRTGTKVKELGIDRRVGELMARMDAISVRDMNSVDIVTSLTDIKPNLNVDPVIAYGFDNEVRLPNIKDKYLLVYTYPGRMNNLKEVKAITDYAQKNNLKIVAIANYFDWVDEVVTPHPFEVLGYFRKARCIVTDTFHGAVMSLKFNKSFAVIVRGMNSNKLSFLLKQFNLSSRIAEQAEDINEILEERIDYVPVNAAIGRERKNTMDYLKSNLK